MGPNRSKVLITLLFVLSVSVFSGLMEGILSAMPKVQRRVLPNQMVLLTSEDHSLPLVTMQLLMDGGSRRDPRGKEGLAYLTAKGLLLGTSRYTLTVFNESLDFMGASLTVSVDQDYARVGLRVLKKDLDKGFDLFMEALSDPTFPEEEIQRQTQKTLGALQSAEERPGEIARKAFQKTLFLDNPYGHPVEGTRDSLQRVTRQAISQFYKTYYHPNNAILAVVGDVTIEEVKARIIPPLSELPMGQIPDEHVRTTFTEGPRTVKIHRNITQANIILGHRGISRTNPDFYAVRVMNYILGGGGFGSRLMEEIRVKRGLAYSVVSYFDPGKYPGSFQIVLQTKNASAQEAIALLRQQMERIQGELVSLEELERAQKYLVGSFPFHLDTQAKLAGFITYAEYYGLGLDYPENHASLIRAVTREDVLRVARAYLHPQKAIVVVVANLKEAGME
jgi:zinc protease